LPAGTARQGDAFSRDRASARPVIWKLPGDKEMGLSVKITTLATVLSFGFLAAMILGML
jgi:hypothetical protein